MPERRDPATLQATINGVLLPLLRRQANGDGIIRGGLKDLLDDALKDQEGTSPLYTSLLQRLGVVELVKPQAGRQPPEWAVSTGDGVVHEGQVAKALEQHRQHVRDTRAARVARRARIAATKEELQGQATKTRPPVHDHRDLQDHEHDGHRGPHDHLYADAEGEGEPYARWHAQRRPVGRTEPSPAVAVAANGARSASDGRHRRLMGLVVELEAKVAEHADLTRQAAERVAHWRERAEQAEARVKELEDLLDLATDPSEAEAEAFLQARGR